VTDKADSALSKRPDPVVCSVQNEVRGRTPIDEREAASIERTLAELDRLEDPFGAAAGPVHVTGSAMVVGPRGVVLLKHRRLGLWVQPGGHVDPGETPWAAAEREAVEETGLVIAPAGGAERAPLVHVDVHDGGRGHTHLDLRYLFDGGGADPNPPPEESQDVHWFAWADAVARAEPSMAALLRHLGSYDRDVAYDEDLADRVRELIAAERGVTEQRMFGGLAFLVDGRMAVGVSGQGGLMVRADPGESDRLAATAGASPMEMKGRPMKGWLRVEAEGVRTKRQLSRWVNIGVGYARSLPPKVQGSTRR